jgi:4a-hydroxytetrahydrobiopterin dehydratase
VRYVALSPAEIDAALVNLRGWSFRDDRLTKTLKFADFRAAMRFMAACVEPIEALNHHPTWSNTYSTVSIELTTHDVGNRVTNVDVELATAIEGVLSQSS